MRLVGLLLCSLRQAARQLHFHSPIVVEDPSLAKYYNSILNDAHFEYANLSNSDLRYIDLTHTDLINANLSNANLKGAMITQNQLAQTSSLQGATMPDGSIHP